MFFRLREILRGWCLVTLLVAATGAGAFALASWRGVLRDAAGKPIGTATVRLSSIAGDRHYVTGTAADGGFAFPQIVGGNYLLAVERDGKTWSPVKPVVVNEGVQLTFTLQLSPQASEVRVLESGEAISVQGSGGELLTSSEVSSLPLNARDFSKLLLLAAGTMTDANGAANFTQQFAVNGQRGTATCSRSTGSTRPIRKWAARLFPTSTWTPSRKCRPARE